MSEEHRTLSDDEIVTTPADERFRRQEDSDLGDDSDTNDSDTDDTDSDTDDTDA